MKKIETDLTPEEKAIIEAGEREYAVPPKLFSGLKIFKQR
jgi:hypothetical protein